MGFFDLFSWGKEPENPGIKKIKELEVKRAMVMLRLSREKEKLLHDSNKISSYSKAINLLDEEIKKVKSELNNK